MEKHRLSGETIMGLLMLGVMALLILYACFFSPYGINEITSAGRLQAPSAGHPMGTDHLSRDLLVRVGQGGFWSLYMAVGIVFIGAVGGMILGALAGYFGGWVDWLISLVINMLLGFPGILMALLVVTVAGQGVGPVVWALGVAFIPSFALVVRSGLRSLKERNFVKRLEIMDAPPLRIVFVHLLPLLRDQYLDAMVIGLANALLAESALSFLGFGIQPPRPSWGKLLSESRGYFFDRPGYALFPGACIVFTALAILLTRRGFSQRKAGH